MAWFNFSNLTAGNQPTADFDTLAAQIAQSVVVPCTVSGGANNLLLTPAANAPAVPSYSEKNLFIFQAATGSTGLVQAQIAGLSVIPLFIAGGTTQATNGSLVAGAIYIVAFQTSLAANGGFVIVSATPSTSLSLPVVVANGGTGVTLFTANAPIVGGTTSTGPLQSVSSAGTVGQGLISTGSGTAPTMQNVMGQLLHVRDEESSGVSAGTFTSGSWVTRVLNTVKTNEITGSSLAANQIVLPAGTYFIEAYAPAFKVDDNKAKLANITDSTDILIGRSDVAEQTGNGSCNASVFGRFTLAAQKTVALQHQCLTTQAANGLGAACGFSVVEVYAEVMIWKVG